MLSDYIAVGFVLILLIAAMVALFSILPSLGPVRYEKRKHISFKFTDIVKRLAYESEPPVKDSSYLEPYESGEIAKKYKGNFISIQYYVVLLLFLLFDIDMLLLFPWAFNFKTLGFYPFIETLIFLAMPVFVVYYAFKEKYMEWLK